MVSKPIYALGVGLCSLHEGLIFHLVAHLSMNAQGVAKSTDPLIRYLHIHTGVRFCSNIYFESGKIIFARFNVVFH